MKNWEKFIQLTMNWVLLTLFWAAGQGAACRQKVANLKSLIFSTFKSTNLMI
jgi:hypothetical protein